MKKIVLFSLILGSAVGIFTAVIRWDLGSAPEASLEEYRETRPYFGAYFTIRFYYDKRLTDLQAVLRECWTKLDEFQVNMNAQSPMGYLSIVNRLPAGEEAFVPDDLYRMIRDAVGYSEKTNGAFDITVRPLVQLWRRAAENNRLPASEEIRETLEKIGAKNIRLGPNHSVSLARAGVQLDLNAIAPAFAVDRIAGILKSHRIDHFMVDGSGEIRCQGHPRGERAWRFGVQDPARKDEGGILHVLEFKDAGVSTSGNYERYFTIQGRQYSHIIDPRTGQPANGVVSATVIAPTAETANGYSTAFCVLGGREALNLLVSAKGVEAFLIENKDGKKTVYETPGYRKFVVRT